MSKKSRIKDSMESYQLSVQQKEDMQKEFFSHLAYSADIIGAVSRKLRDMRHKPHALEWVWWYRDPSAKFTWLDDGSLSFSVNTERVGRSGRPVSGARFFRIEKVFVEGDVRSIAKRTRELLYDHNKKEFSDELVRLEVQRDEVEAKIDDVRLKLSRIEKYHMDD